MNKEKRKRRVFISYSHKNKRLIADFRSRFDEHLKASKHYEYELWQDINIAPGQLWEEEIIKAIKTCDLALLFVSPSFLSSSYIVDKELPNLIAHAKKIVPIALCEIDFELHDLQGLDSRQIYFLDKESFDKPRSYSDLKNKRRDDFVIDLFRKIEKL